MRSFKMDILKDRKLKKYASNAYPRSNVTRKTGIISNVSRHAIGCFHTCSQLWQTVHTNRSFLPDEKQTKESNTNLNLFKTMASPFGMSTSLYRHGLDCLWRRLDKLKGLNCESNWRGIKRNEVGMNKTQKGRPGCISDHFKYTTSNISNKLSSEMDHNFKVIICPNKLNDIIIVKPWSWKSLLQRTDGKHRV